MYFEEPRTDDARERWFFEVSFIRSLLVMTVRDGEFRPCGIRAQIAHAEDRGAARFECTAVFITQITLGIEPLVQIVVM